MRAIPLLALLTACVRDPTFFGYWDIVEVEHGGVVQEDVGFFEVNDDTSMTLFVRYAWAGDAFAPDPQPEPLVGGTNASRQEFLGNYSKKGEVHHLLITGLFGPEVRFEVEEYYADEAVLSAPDAIWPGGSQPLETVLAIQR